MTAICGCCGQPIPQTGAIKEGFPVTGWVSNDGTITISYPAAMPSSANLVVTTAPAVAQTAN